MTDIERLGRVFSNRPPRVSPERPFPGSMSRSDHKTGRVKSPKDAKKGPGKLPGPSCLRLTVLQKQ